MAHMTAAYASILGSRNIFVSTFAPLEAIDPFRKRKLSRVPSEPDMIQTAQ